MVRQCAWCLRLIDSAGERVSPSPLPKLYEASHGMCSTCGMVWITQVIEARGVQGSINNTLAGNGIEVAMVGSYPTSDLPVKESITQFVLDVQQNSVNTPRALQSRCSRKLRIM